MPAPRGWAQRPRRLPAGPRGGQNRRSGQPDGPHPAPEGLQVADQVGGDRVALRAPGDRPPPARGWWCVRRVRLAASPGSPWTIQTSLACSGTNDRSPPGSRVVGTESPLGRCMMKLTGLVSSTSGISYPPSRQSPRSAATACPTRSGEDRRVDRVAPHVQAPALLRRVAVVAGRPEVVQRRRLSASGWSAVTVCSAVSRAAGRVVQRGPVRDGGAGGQVQGGAGRRRPCTRATSRRCRRRSTRRRSTLRSKRPRGPPAPGRRPRAPRRCRAPATLGRVLDRQHRRRHHGRLDLAQRGVPGVVQHDARYCSGVPGAAAR